VARHLAQRIVYRDDCHRAGIFVGTQVPDSWSLDFTLALTFIALANKLGFIITGVAILFCTDGEAAGFLPEGRYG
jgi:hypothetical protein